ncbi:MAG: hypothetical protein A2044_01545 [Candidatus Firestonebacteria bacterium GWA2_43_8]|nr:MAG: hypothetical protein A2044_01545 [Candidatus Firestonebacteria bacterium GWA2_43_8]
MKTFKLRIKKDAARDLGKFSLREKKRFKYFRRKFPVILDALNKTKIKYAVLKGGFLAFDIFPPGSRYLSDIDIVVMENDRCTAEKALAREGFKKEESKSSKNVTVMTDPNGLEVELATELGVLKSILPVEELLCNTVKVKLVNRTARVLRNEYNLLHLCLHASMTHSFYDISKLVDINEFLKSKHIDIEEFELLARKKGVYRAVFIPIQQCGIFWKNPAGLKYNIKAGLAVRLIRYNLESALKTEYDKRSAFYGYLIPVLIADSWRLRFKMIMDYMKSREWGM